EEAAGRVAELRSWAAAAGGQVLTETTAGAAVGLDAARRALRGDGTPGGPGRPVLLEGGPPAAIAGGAGGGGPRRRPPAGRGAGGAGAAPGGGGPGGARARRGGGAAQGGGGGARWGGVGR